MSAATGAITAAPVLEGSGRLRLLTVFVLYAAQGLPISMQTLRTSFSPMSLAWLPVIIVVGLSYGVYLVALPLIASGHAGWTEARVGSLNGTAQLIAGIAAIVVGGVAVAKIGAQHSMQYGFVAFIALLGWLVANEADWSYPRTVTIFGFGWLLLYALVGIGQVVIIMRMCPPDIDATQFSVFMSFSNFGITLAGLLIGSIAALAGPRGMLLLLIAAHVVALAILCLVRFPTRGVSGHGFCRTPLPMTAT